MKLSLQPLTGILAACTLAAVIPWEFLHNTGTAWFSGVSVCLLVAVLLPGVPWSRRIFVLIGLILMLLCVLFLPDWQHTLADALQRAAFIAAFFTATACIRSAAGGSPSMTRCGYFLANQPPGRRYLALTTGGHLFGLILSYGAITLLSTLATASNANEKNAEIQRYRSRRMLVAIQRGFVSALPWTPLGFAMAISSILVPGALWIDALLPCLVSSLIMILSGWTLDSLFKPRLSTPIAVGVKCNNDWWHHLRPLVTLLLLITTIATLLHILTGVRIVGIIMLIVPLIALLWTGMQAGHVSFAKRLAHSASRTRQFLFADLPILKSEMVLLIMAGFIGVAGASLVSPVIGASGIDLSDASPILVLLSLFWLIQIAGQLGMNPILAVSLFAPLLPAPSELGISSTAMLVAMTSGWAMTGATSPFTASTLLMANFGQVSGRYAGLVWNGGYALLCGALLSGWICVVATYF
ncbi:MAG: hypothetical protein AB8B63_00870 [Granulosicoccus sp.]